MKLSLEHTKEKRLKSAEIKAARRQSKIIELERKILLLEIMNRQLMAGRREGRSMEQGLA